MAVVEQTVIELETAQVVLRVVEVKRNRRALVRVALGPGDAGQESRCMWVVLPAAVVLPAVGAVVSFEGLRLVLAEVGGLVRPIVRACGVREVVDGDGVAAA